MPQRASPNVKARGTPVYAAAQLGRGVQGSVGEGLGSGTSGDSGYTQILTGQNDVKVNGLPVGRHDSLALINCDANGCGGALAQLQVAFKPLSVAEQLQREASKTPDDLRADMERHRMGRAEANARADAIDRQIDDLRAQADRASSWNPLNAERRAIARQIEALNASQRSAASTALWHADEMLRAFERLHPELAAGPAHSASPDRQETREYARRAADIQRGWDTIDARRSGVGGAIASMAGLPPELAQAVNGITTLGRGGLRVQHSAAPVRPQRRRHQAQNTQPQQPAPARTPPPARPPATPPRPGVYVQPPPRTPLIKLRCFKKNKKGSPDEYDRQLADQERGLNDLSVKDYLEGRARYKEIGRKGTGAAQEAAREKYAKELTDRFVDELLRTGLGRAAAQQQAAAMAAEQMKTLAALHNPDMIAGGKDVVTSMGDRGVNSSIGAQWQGPAGTDKDRVAVLDREALKVPEHERASTKMNAKLVRCK